MLKAIQPLFVNYPLALVAGAKLGDKCERGPLTKW